MQCMLLPEAVLNKLNSDIAKFLWGKGEGRKYVHLVSWDLISRPKDEGVWGLGVIEC